MKKLEHSTITNIFKFRTITTLLGIVVLSGAGCGDDKTAGERAKDVTDAVVNKTEDIKDAVVGASPTRSEVEAKYDEQSSALSKKIAELEQKYKDETDAEIKAANEARLNSLRTSVTAANERIAELKKSAEAEWTAKKDATSTAIDNASAKISSALEREKLRERVDSTLVKMEAKIEALKSDAAEANAEVKAKLEEDREKLEEKYDSLKKDYNRFQESTEEKWDDFKESFERSFKDLSDTFKGWFD